MKVFHNVLSGVGSYGNMGFDYIPNFEFSGSFGIVGAVAVIFPTLLDEDLKNGFCKFCVTRHMPEVCEEGGITIII